MRPWARVWTNKRSASSTAAFLVLAPVHFIAWSIKASSIDTGVADAATIDRAYRNAAGLWASFCGPFRWIDITGGAALYARAMERVVPELSCVTEVPAVLQRQAELDRKAIAESGDTAATGFYGETPEQKKEWLELLHRQAWEIEALRSRMDEAMAKAGVTKVE